MNTQSNPLKHFRWRATLIRFLINAATLFIVVVLTPEVYFVDPTFLHLLVGALVLGILNATIKPIIQFFTLPFIFASYGLIIILINSFMIWLLSRIFPEALAVDRIFWALVAGALYGIVSSFLESLFGLNEPIFPDDDPEDIALREQVDAESVGIFRAIVDHQDAKAQDSAALAEVTSDEKDEQERPMDSAAPAEAGEEIAGSADEGTVEENAELVANPIDEKDDTASDEEAPAVAHKDPQAPIAEGGLKFQASENETSEESAEEEVKS